MQATDVARTMAHQDTLDAPACDSGGRRSDVDMYTDGRMFTFFVGDCLPIMKSLDPASIDLILTSPPYNLGQEYERRRLRLNDYLSWHRKVIDECCRIVKTDGSICWQVGNYVEKGEVWPLDILLHPMFKANGFRLRNRIVWHFRHGVHQTRRFSGRYEVVLWFTRSDSYVFDLDSVRVPQLYPTKRHFRGPHRGDLSCNPLGKNPSDVWDITNVKNNHPEKTPHPCQYPQELAKRLILSLSRKGELVLDPFLGSGTTAIAALAAGRRTLGIEILRKYVAVALERIGFGREPTTL